MRLGVLVALAFLFFSANLWLGLLLLGDGPPDHGLDDPRQFDPGLLTRRPSLSPKPMWAPVAGQVACVLRRPDPTTHELGVVGTTALPAALCVELEWPASVATWTLEMLHQQRPAGAMRGRGEDEDESEDNVVLFMTVSQDEIVVNNREGGAWGSEARRPGEARPGTAFKLCVTTTYEHADVRFGEAARPLRFHFRRPWTLLPPTQPPMPTVLSVSVPRGEGADAFALRNAQCNFNPASPQGPAHGSVQHPRSEAEQQRRALAAKDWQDLELVQLAHDTAGWTCSWRSVRGCDAGSEGGERVPDEDLDCGALIAENAAGYCELVPPAHVAKAPVQFKRLSCGHAVTTCDAFKFRARAREHMDALQAFALVSRFSGRGIVVLVHRGVMASAWASIRLLRTELGCELPIELWHKPGEVEADNAAAQGLLELGVVFRELRTTLEGYMLKPTALLESSFEEVLLLDADNVPALDPTVLFEGAEYQRTGAVFWPDFWHPHTRHSASWHVRWDSPVWELAGVEYAFMFEQESGQVLVDKRKAWAALHLLQFYAQQSAVLERGRRLLGDKDLYRFAWMATGTAFHMVQHPPAAAGVVDAKDGHFCGGTMVQFTPGPSPGIAFLHRNMFKLGTALADDRYWTVLQTSTEADPKRFQVKGVGKLHVEATREGRALHVVAHGSAEAARHPVAGSCWRIVSASRVDPMPPFYQQLETRLLEFYREVAP